MLSTFLVADVLVDDSVDTPTSFIATSNVLSIQLHTLQQQVSRHSSFGVIKLYGFHAIMLSYYLMHQVSHWVRPRGLHILMLILHPILPWLRSIVYWGTISTTVVSLLFIEAIKIYAANQAAKDNPTTVTYPATSPYPLLFIRMQYAYPPLPSRYMVLSGVMLLQSFI